MCDSKNNNLNSGISFVAGAVLGALVGAAAVVLLNPATGQDTRKKLANTAKKYSQKGEEIVDEALETVTKVKQTSQPYIQTATEKIAPYIATAAESFKKTTKPGLDAFANYTPEPTAEPAERINMIVEDSLPKAKKQSNRTSKKYFKKVS
jgi:gas vesicle protein